VNTVDAGPAPIDLNPYEVREYINAHQKRLTDWDMSQTMSSAAPKGWSVAWPTVNDNIAVNDLFDKAKALKADVLLNIAEANQMWPAIQSLATCIPEMAYQWGRIRKVLATASGSFLAWKFGISPIISDLESIQKFAPDLNRQIQRFSKGEANRYTRVFTGTCQYVVDTSFNGTVNGVKTWLREATARAILPPTTRYVLVVEPAVRYKTEVFNTLATCIERFSSSPASFAWEKVPWSFVADWFVDLRGPLRAIDEMIGHSPYKIISLTKSQSYRLATTGTLKWTNPCTSATMLSLNTGVTEYSHYERSLLSPSASPEWKVRFGKNQAAISAALITQKLSAIRR
jgi:hypothetical protein